MNPRRIAFVLMLLVTSMAITPGAAAAPMSKTLNIVGGEKLFVNHRIIGSFHFSPGTIQIASGGSITIVQATTDPHSISIVNAADLPTTIAQVFGCGAPGTVCFTVAKTHIPNGFDPSGNPIPPVYFFVAVPGYPAYFSNGTMTGSSQLLPPIPGFSLTLTVIAPPGTTIHFMCIIHPWMQGVIQVG